MLKADPHPPSKPVGLALQGGGSWGAFTWGVLEALLSCPEVNITQLSGTSAGAINAAIVASVLAKGSRKEAINALKRFWGRIADPATVDILRIVMGSLGRYWMNSLSDWLFASATLGIPGAQALGVNPLRDVVAEFIDIDAIRSARAPALFITVTNARTGLPRVITNAEMSVDAVLASACLPRFFPAVELDGEHYWDGGYAGNPKFWPMIQSGLADDLILVQLLPDRVDDVPCDLHGIRRRVGEIAFNASVVAEMRALVTLREVTAGSHAPPRAATVRLHRIGPPGAHLFDQGNAGDHGTVWLQLLHEEGLHAGRRFVSEHLGDLGKLETLEIHRVFYDTHQSPLVTSQSDEHITRRIRPRAPIKSPIR